MNKHRLGRLLALAGALLHAMTCTCFVISVQAVDSETSDVITSDNVPSVRILESIALDEDAVVADIDFSPDSRRIVISESSYAQERTRSLRIWNLIPFEEQQIPAISQLGSIFTAAFAPNGRYLVAAGRTGEAVFIDIENEMIIDTVVVSTENVNAIAFSPDGALVGFANAFVPIQPDTPLVIPDELTILNIIDAETRASIFSWRPDYKSSNLGGASSLSFSSDGEYVALGQDGNNVRVWNLATYAVENYTSDGSVGITSVAFNPDGSLLAASYGNGTITIWRTEDQEEVLSFDGGMRWSNDIVFSQDGSLLIFTDWDGNIRFIDNEAGEEVFAFQAHEGPIISLTLSPDGALLASGGTDGTVRLWGIPNE